MKLPPKKFTTEKHTKTELMKLADDLSKGKYKKESQQRKRILQMIADELKESSGSPP